MFIYLFQYKRTYDSDYTWINVPPKLHLSDLESITEIIPYVINRKMSSIHIKEVANGIIMCKYQESNQVDEYGRQTYEVKGIFVDTTEDMINSIKQYILEYLIVCEFDYARDVFHDSSSIRFLSLDWVQNVVTHGKRTFRPQIGMLQHIDCFVDSEYVITPNPFFLNSNTARTMISANSTSENICGDNITNHDFSNNFHAPNSEETLKVKKRGWFHKRK